MTKGEFIDEVATRTGLSKKDAGAAVDAVLAHDQRHAEEGWRRRLHRLRQVPRHEALGAHRRQPAEPGPEGPDPGGDRAEVLRRLDAQGRRPRLAGCRRSGVRSDRANIRSHGWTDATPSRASRRAAPAGARSGRPARGTDRGERRAARSRTGGGCAPGAAARAGRAGTACARGGRAGRCAPRAPRRRRASVSSGSRRRRARRWTRRSWTVVDLETTGVGASARIVEIGAVRLEGDRAGGTISRLVDPGIPMPPRITQITGIRDRDLAGAGPLRPGARPNCSRSRAAASSWPTTRPSTSACSIARWMRSTARAWACACSTRSRSPGGLLAGRLARFDLASVSERFDVTVRPCHRALPDALATAEVLRAR